MKYLLLLAVVVLVLWAMRRPALPRKPDAPRGAPPQPQPPALEPMLRCSHCGLHLPRSEALADPDGRAWCCAAHRAAGPGPGAGPRS